MEQKTIYTVTANCQDCYRCVRACPVKAIRVSGCQAKVEDELCIKCGTCVQECPQKAKKIRSDSEHVKELLKSGQSVVASVAPSFAAAYGGSLAGRLPSALRRLGFSHVSETAEGAKYVTGKCFDVEYDGNICTACPAVVNYVEKYKPELLDSLIPIVSPMIAHGRMLKEAYPGSAVVFIGPCAAKKHELKRPENQGAVDYALTFSELAQWLLDEDITMENCSESAFENQWHIGDARLFPLQGGMLKTGGIAGDGVSGDILHVSGADEVIELLSEEKILGRYQYIEPLFCKGGCIGGPDFTGEKNLFTRREMLISYADFAKSRFEYGSMPKEENEINCTAGFADDSVPSSEITESQINKIFERTGKTDPVFQLNCGACGYKTCEDNAIAVIKGMAEPEMCIPYMRRLAQQRTDRIIETAPSGIVVLDSELCIINMNPAFQKMFMCNNGILGRRISYIVEAEGYEELLSGRAELSESMRVKYGLRYHETLYALRDEQQYVGIYADISKLKFDSKQLDVIKSQTLIHAQEFLEHQVRFAQEMAHYLGKSTAKSEEIAKRLISLYKEDGE